MTEEDQLAWFWRIFLLPSLPMGTGGDTVLCAGQWPPEAAAVPRVVRA